MYFANLISIRNRCKSNQIKTILRLSLITVNDIRKTVENVLDAFLQGLISPALMFI